MLQNQHLLIICTVWPEPASSAAGSRMLQIIELFLDHECRITLACDANETEYSDDLSAYRLDKLKIVLNDSAVDEQLKSLNPSFVLFDRFMTEEKYGWRVAEQCPNALRILDTEDLHCLRKARQDAFKKQTAYTPAFLLNDLSKREIASIYRCDLSLIISTYEMELLQSFFKIDKTLLHYIPFLLDPLTPAGISTLPGYEERAHFISIGNFLHEPNTNAVLYLKEEIWPMIRKALPGAELHIYGAYVPEKINNLHRPEQGFYIKGRAVHSGQVVEHAKVLLAPLRFGAGIKGKLTEAMQCGTPSVTTSIGAEGMHGTLDWNGYISDDPAAFAHCAVELYTSEKKWHQAQSNGYTIINEFYSKEAHSNIFIQTVLQVQKNLDSHRASNFIGSMLLHHTLAGTKFMSKWIELKNKT
jgi:glycosyltransferase involved in cell wall biosynthesis